MLPSITARSARLVTSAISCDRCLNFPAKLSFRLYYLCPQFDSLHALKPDTHFSHVKIQFLPLREHISPQLERSITYCYTCMGQCVHCVNHTKERETVWKNVEIVSYICTLKGYTNYTQVYCNILLSLKVIYFSSHTDWYFKAHELISSYFYVHVIVRRNKFLCNKTN
jgi:hypothetical protein